jgi:FMN phosphatase YigB (HAD superfamily)
MQKALYIDFDGTLTRDRYWRSLKSEEHTKIQDLLFGADRSIVHDWMRGGSSAEAVNQYAAEALGLSYEYLWEVFVQDCRQMHVPRQTLDLINALRTKYVTILITGNMDSFTRFTQPALGLEQCFDHISNSYYEKKHKTDNGGELFNDWAERTGIPLGNSILIDDQSKCCDIFSSLGGYAIQTDSPEFTHSFLERLR